MTRTSVLLIMLVGLASFGSGCGSSSTPENVDQRATADANLPSEEPEQEYVFEAVGQETTADQLLSARLPLDELRAGWVRLFDQHTLFGWTIEGQANWRVEDNAIVVDRGNESLLHSSSRWTNFELDLEYQMDAQTDSGVLIRCLLQPADVLSDSIEINLAPSSDPFPTGSLVGRQVAKTLPDDFDSTAWHRLNIRCQDETVVVQIDGNVICEQGDVTAPSSGSVALQHRRGRVAFRNLRIRPLGLESLLDPTLTQWKRYPDMPGEYRVNDDGELVVDGGKQQLESKALYGDFVLLAEYQMPTVESNSGIFFRSIPGDVMMGYECQVNDEFLDGNPLRPADGGAGGIFRRQDARLVASEPNRWNVILLHTRGARFNTWVNGVQVVDTSDTRPPDPNPRRGQRLQPGTLIIQGHDPTTRARYRQLAIRDETIEPTPTNDAKAEASED